MLSIILGARGCKRGALSPSFSMAAVQRDPDMQDGSSGKMCLGSGSLLLGVE